MSKIATRINDFILDKVSRTPVAAGLAGTTAATAIGLYGERGGALAGLGILGTYLLDRYAATHPKEADPSRTAKAVSDFQPDSSTKKA